MDTEIYSTPVYGRRESGREEEEKRRGKSRRNGEARKEVEERERRKGMNRETYALYIYISAVDTKYIQI